MKYSKTKFVTYDVVKSPTNERRPPTHVTTLHPMLSHRAVASGPMKNITPNASDPTQAATEKTLKLQLKILFGSGNTETNLQ